MVGTGERQISQWQLVEERFSELATEVDRELAVALGSVALHEVVQIEQPEDTRDVATLYAAVHEASLGSAEARALIRSNVATDVSERLFKVGRSKVGLNIDQNGQFIQHGRRLIDIQRNTLAYTSLNEIMQRRTISEIRNLMLAEALLPTGMLDTHDLLVFSPATQDAQTKKEFGFFADTDSCSVQLMSVNGAEVTLETALVAGKPTPSSPRHDIDAIKRLAATYDVDIHSEDADDIVRYLMLIPKEETEPGIHAIVRRYDESIGGVFWGQASDRTDYAAFVAECEERERNYESIIGRITEQLINESAAFSSPLEVIARLDELSERYCVRAAVSNAEVDAAVFGIDAAIHIHDARLALERGDYDAAQTSISRAQKTAVSGSCPLRKLLEEATETSGDDKKADTSDGKKKWMKCPHCDARVFDDPCAQVLSCWDCHALVINGKVKSTGDGGSKRRKQERVTEKKNPETSKSKQQMHTQPQQTNQVNDAQPADVHQEQLEDKAELATL